ncbi:MarR family transcriptional regulator [uncultured Ferrovibrio sp.]|jgi:DNA-binding MarR family transcriptional regulator|uniref:MarR family winged helix-turn-helix transcriptional regulator n=1 Tax=uncultured Ferrovibrio sp. TaxID=1576913 RepID=UPI002620E902|nr:MarR family transcriptional regulator [uncultured Ferrovibrio sp.]
MARSRTTAAAQKAPKTAAANVTARGNGITRKIDRGPLPGYYGYNLRIAQVAVFEDFARIVGRMADRMGELTPGRFSLLTLLKHNPGINQTDLSRAVGLDKSTLTPALDQLERNGLILRQRTAADRRTYALSLSEKGKALLDDLNAKVLQHERNIVASLSPSERATLLRLLKKIARSLGSGAVE